MNSNDTSMNISGVKTLLVFAAILVLSFTVSACYDSSNSKVHRIAQLNVTPILLKKDKECGMTRCRYTVYIYNGKGRAEWFEVDSVDYKSVVIGDTLSSLVLREETTIYEKGCIEKVYYCDGEKNKSVTDKTSTGN